MARATTQRPRTQKRSANPALHLPKVEPAAPEQVFETFVQSNEAILAGMAALNSEIATFCNTRLRENAERSDSLMNCSDPEDAFKVQWEFYQRATEQYLNQTSTLLGIMAKITEDFLTPFQEQQRSLMQSFTSSEGDVSKD